MPAATDPAALACFLHAVQVYLVRRLWADSVQTAARESDRWLRAFFSRDEVRLSSP